MWYLSRKPSSEELITSRTSVFSSDRSTLEDLSIFITDDEQQQNQTDALQNHNPWQWFAYQNAPNQFLAVAVPHKTQIISICAEYFLCARMIFPPSEPQSKKREPYAKLCAYLRHSNDFLDLPSCTEVEGGHVRDLFTAACAILNGCLYVAGGYKANTSFSAETNSSDPLASAERLNLALRKWEVLPPLPETNTCATGVAHNGRFYVIGDGKYGRSAQVYIPASNLWYVRENFIPEEAKGYTVGTVNGRMILFTWSDHHGAKLWCLDNAVVQSPNPWQLMDFYGITKVEKLQLNETGAKLVTIGKEVLIMIGLQEYCRYFCWVDHLSAWPVLAAPFLQPCNKEKISSSEHICSFRITTRNLFWKKYPIYRIGVTK